MHEVLVEVSGEVAQDNYNQLVASGYLLALNCFNTCQNTNKVQIVPVLLSLATVKTTGGPKA